MEGHGIVWAGALIEQAGHHTGHARLVTRILVRAAEDGEFKRDHGSGIAHQPGFDPAGANDPLDRHRVRGSSRQKKHGRGEERRECASAAAANGKGRIHERFSSERASLMR